MKVMEYRQLTKEEVAQRKKRNIVTALVLAGLFILFFVTTIVRLSNNIAG